VPIGSHSDSSLRVRASAPNTATQRGSRHPFLGVGERLGAPGAKIEKFAKQLKIHLFLNLVATYCPEVVPAFLWPSCAVITLLK